MIKYNGIILIILITSTAYIGDEIVFRSKLSKYFVFRAFADNLVHALIGFFSSLLFFSNDYSISSEAVAMNVGLCTFLSSIIDVDHILVAKSLLWKDITNVKQRGIFHCTTISVGIIVIFLLYSYIIRKNNFIIIGFMALIACSSHQIRDANRRGLWIYPFGHTKAINVHFYVSLICLLPLVYYYVYKYTKPTFKYTTVHHKIV